MIDYGITIQILDQPEDLGNINTTPFTRAGIGKIEITLLWNTLLEILAALEEDESQEE